MNDRSPIEHSGRSEICRIAGLFVGTERFDFVKVRFAGLNHVVRATGARKRQVVNPNQRLVVPLEAAIDAISNRRSMPGVARSARIPKKDHFVLSLDLRV